MCFSAGASFTAGVVISSIGIATELKVKEPSQRLFASIPLIFGVQQIAEGFVWVSLQKPGLFLLMNICTYIFLIVANIIWPIMIPASCLLMERNPKKRKIFKVLLLSGTILALYYGFCMLAFNVTPEILNCHINYVLDFPKPLAIPAFLLYLVVTITPLMLSSVKRMYWLGIMLFIGVVVSLVFYIENVTSVWCFFGAVISGMIYWVLNYRKLKLRS